MVNKEKGIVLYIAVFFISVFLGIIFSLTNILLSQIKIFWQAGDSAKAFSATDTGVEQALYNIRKLEVFGESQIDQINLSNGSSYSVIMTTDANGGTATIQSKGVFRKARRVIEAKY